MDVVKPIVVYSFIYITRSKFFPLCTLEKFEAGIELITRENTPAISELVTEHGMKRFVMDSVWKSPDSEAFDANPNHACKIWIINDNTIKLVTVRHTWLHTDQTAASKDTDELLQNICLLTKENEKLIKKLEENFGKLQEANKRRKNFRKPHAESELAHEDLEVLAQRVQEKQNQMHEEQIDVAREKKQQQLKDEQIETSKKLREADARGGADSELLLRYLRSFHSIYEEEP